MDSVRTTASIGIPSIKISNDSATLQEAKADEKASAPKDTCAFSNPTIEHVESGVKFTQQVNPKQTISGLETLVQNGTIQSFSFDKDGLVVYAGSEEALKNLQDLKVTDLSSYSTGVIGKLKELFVPPNINENCAPEYLKYRGWCLAAAVAAGTIGFMNSKVIIDAVNLGYSNSTNAALAGVLNAYIGKATSMVGSYLGHKGDIDPKTCFLTSSMISSANALITMGVLCMCPGAHLAITALTAVTGALAGALGSAAGVNIFNHMAKGEAKGTVATKNSNQDMIADMFGMPIALGLSQLALKFGMNPYMLAIGVAGPALLFCGYQAAKAIRMESLPRSEMQKLADNFINNQQVMEAEGKGMLKQLKRLFAGDDGQVSDKIKYMDSMEGVIEGDNTKELFSLFRNDNYLLNIGSDGNINIAFKKNVNMGDIFKANVQARLIESAMESDFYGVLQQQCGHDADYALLDLTHRVLPDSFSVQEQLGDKGWNTNTASLRLQKLESSWTGEEKDKAAPVTMEQLKSLMQNVDLAILKGLVRKEYLDANAPDTIQPIQRQSAPEAPPVTPEAATQTAATAQESSPTPEFGLDQKGRPLEREWKVGDIPTMEEIFSGRTPAVHPNFGTPILEN